MKLSFRHFYWRWLKNLILLFLLALLFMSLARSLFTLYFGDTSIFERVTDLKKAFILGTRFDLIPLAYINVIPFLILNVSYFFSGKSIIKTSRFLMITFLWLGYSILGWLYICDYGFYSYFQDHLNILFFGLFEDDTVAVLTSIHKNYNLLLWLFLVGGLHYFFYRLLKLLFSPFDFDLKSKRMSFKQPLVFVFGLILIAFLARGNFSRLPLSVEDAFISEIKFINEIALNGVLTLNRAIRIRRTHGGGDYNYLKEAKFHSWQEAFESSKGVAPQTPDLLDSLKSTTKTNIFLESNPPHVVLIVMESFGTYWLNYDNKKFQLLGELKSHLDQGIYFKNFLPADNGTIGSINSVVTSQVIRPGARFLSESKFMKTSLASSGHLAFKENGYETHFVYGGKLGWRDLGKFLAIQKYDHLWGADEIKQAMPELRHLAENDLGNEWGIFDEYLYHFIDERLKTAAKPQMFLVLTTTNHPPFEYPSSYKPLPLEFSEELLSKVSIGEELAKKRFLGTQYANHKVGEFLTRIHKSNFGDKTIVALTGDHSFWIAKGVGQEEEFKRYAVPFFLSVPEAYRPRTIDESKFGSHEDIFPTLINLSLSNQKYLKLGEDLFSELSYAMNSSGLIASKEGAYHNGKFWKWLDLENQILTPVEDREKEQFLKRKAQGLIGITDLYLKEEKKSKKTALNNDPPK